MQDEALADLHCHTNRSDGTLPPGELVAAAAAAGLRAVAVTDHDTTAGVAEALVAGRRHGIEVVPGIEISTRCGNREVHLLGLFVDHDANCLVDLSEQQRAWREERARVMVERGRALGLDMDLQRVRAAAAGAPIGRPHMAQVLVDAGAVSQAQEAFDRYLGTGKVCHVPKRMVSTTDAIALVHQAGGVAVCAHPAASRVREKRLRLLQEAGLDGAEVVHPRHGRARRASLKELCDRLGLLPSGGSDFHGPGRGDARLGDHSVPLAWCDELRQRSALYPATRG